MAEKPRKRPPAKPAGKGAAEPNMTAGISAPPEAAAAGVVFSGDGRIRAVTDAIFPDVDCGRFPAKRVAGEPVCIEAHCFTDGHDKLRVLLSWASEANPDTHDVDMRSEPNDVWVAEFTPPAPGRYRYTVSAWVDHFASWRAELARRDDGADVRIALQVGAVLIEDTVPRAAGQDSAELSEWAALLRRTATDSSVDLEIAAMKALALDAAKAAIVMRHPDRNLSASMTRELFVDRKRAQFGSWYEMFPRSAASEPHQHGSFRDLEERLPYVARMGFDVLYLPPIHPIGRINRKGANNSLQAQPDDVGSPWAIGAAEGGHKDILPALGSLNDFLQLLRRARELDLEIALDLAFQCAPDHPYVASHPDWFKHRPDGSIQYAENPPKKYQDIYPFDFECDDWRGLWSELKSVVEFWIAQGVRIFRVDNPHTKSFAFWEWLIGEIQRAEPSTIFLAEAFTRPKVMHRLAKLGFTQSYTYFTWRTAKQELIEYFTELSHGPGRDYFRPNVWPNTPDILHESLQSGGRATFSARLVLAATLSANYGIYGPAYELMESAPRSSGSEEYRDSEKYQLRHWPLDRPDSLWPLIARINRIRRDNPALHFDGSLEFCPIDNDLLIAYVKHDVGTGNIIIVVVNLDPRYTQSGWIELDLTALGLDQDRPFQVHDQLSDQRFQWQGKRNFVLLDPHRIPAHVFKLRRHVRSERDFDYFL